MPWGQPFVEDHICDSSYKNLHQKRHFSSIWTKHRKLVWAHIYHRGDKQCQQSAEEQKKMHVDLHKEIILKKDSELHPTMNNKKTTINGSSTFVLNCFGSHGKHLVDSPSVLVARLHQWDTPPPNVPGGTLRAVGGTHSYQTGYLKNSSLGNSTMTDFWRRRSGEFKRWNCQHGVVTLLMLSYKNRSPDQSYATLKMKWGKDGSWSIRVHSQPTYEIYLMISTIKVAPRVLFIENCIKFILTSKERPKLH